jgi:hypothetical protein
MCQSKSNGPSLSTVLEFLEHDKVKEMLVKLPLEKGPQEIKKAISIKKEFLEEGAEKQLNIKFTLRFEIF